LSNNNNLTSIGKFAFAYNGNDLGKEEDKENYQVKLPDSLQTLGDSSFAANNNLKTISFGPNLISIGKNAFSLDGALTDVDFSNANKLTLIDDGAFIYSGVTGDLKTPSSLLTIGNEAFGGAHLDGLELNEGLQSIGNSAFSYNQLKGTLVIPSTIQNIGSNAFISNQLSGVSTKASDIVMGTGAFSNNRITTVLAPKMLGAARDTYNPNIAVNQFAAIFTDTSHNNISDYFNIQIGPNIGGITEKSLDINGLTNYVTYSDGVFTIPNGVKSFSFDWTLASSDSSDQGYSGKYDVIFDDPDIQAISSHISTGTKWSPSDNFLSAKTPEGRDIDLKDMEISIDQSEFVDPSLATIDTTIAEKHTVEYKYKYGNESSTVNVVVDKREGTYTVNGSDKVTYNGQNQAFNPSDYQISLPNGTTYTLQDGDLELKEGNVKNAGTYTVQLSQQGIENIEAVGQNSLYEWTAGVKDNFEIAKAPVTIKANNSSKIEGAVDPTFSANVTMPNDIKDGDELNYSLKREDGLTPGDYAIKVELGDNPNYEVTVENGTFTIIASKQGIVGEDFTMNIGAPMPTADDFKASATDVDGNALEVSVDLGNADLNTVGTYDVTLKSSDGQTKTVSLIVTDPTDPT
ncbi:leucine-rich repeat protein, partial [Companilactobacillus nantensis]